MVSLGVCQSPKSAKVQEYSSIHPTLRVGGDDGINDVGKAKSGLWANNLADRIG